MHIKQTMEMNQAKNERVKNAFVFNLLSINIPLNS